MTDSRFVMISSTSLDLPDHRQQVMDAILRECRPIAMEHLTAEAGSNALKKSYELVDQADIYVGIFAERYGYCPDDPVANPDHVSITELEYRRAVARGIPILLFLSHEDHAFTRKQYEDNPDSRAKLNLLKTKFCKENICGFFKSPEDLRALVIQALSQLLRDRAPLSHTPKPKPVLPQPPALYAVPTYTLTNQFVGRRSELHILDVWAASHDSIMVVEGIGGLGKSALTWEWVLNHAATAIPRFAGYVWWSFYEKGTSMVTFVRHALAYVTGQDPEDLIKDTSHYERGRQLLHELQQRPFLLVLDGFERVLTAYHRLDKAQLPDEQADEGDLRDCVNPQDGDLLTQLLRCQPSKILISTRLFPKILEDRASHCPIVGVQHHKLNGLLPDDAIALMRHAKITGDERAMLEFANQFGRHSLLLRIVCGMIADYRKKPYDFDAWRADPVYGGSLKLTDLDLKQRYTHILYFALRGLDEQTRRLLCRIAVISENAEYTTLAVLNPFLPPRPEVVEEPSDPAKSYRWRRMSKEEQTQAKADYAIARARYEQYLAACEAYPKSLEFRQAVTAFDAALQELEERGLLQWDREINRYDMHPVVRAYAAELLDAGERKETFLKVRDHFEALPPDDLDTATELAHVAHSLEIYRCLIGAGLLEEAADYYRGNLCDILLFHLGAYAVVLELLKPLFRGDFNGLPALESAQKRSYFLNELARCHSELGRKAEALTVYAKTFLIDLEYMAWHNLRIGLSNYGSALSKLNRRAEIAQVYQLARDLADSAEDVDGVSRSILDQMTVAIYKGRFTDVTSLDDEFRQRPQPPLRIYRPGDAEYWRCVSQFCQSQLTDAAWQTGYDLCVRHRNVFQQYQFLALRAQWDLTADRSEQALDAIDQALQITKKLGTPRPDYHDLRAWALARLGRPTEAHAALQDGEQRLYAAEAYRVLGDTAQARTCALNAYRGAWGEGPPYIHWYYLERSRALLRELGEPEPQLPPFDPSKVPPIPYEKEIRAAIAKLRAEKAQREQDDSA